MSQHDYNFENQAGLSFRADINDLALAIATNNSGATEPTTTFAHQFWQDTSSGFLKQRDASNTSWLTLTTDGKASSVSNTPAGNITATNVQAAIIELDVEKLPTSPILVDAVATNNIGRKNLLINADFRVNERMYASATATTAANQYTIDRWRVITTGQSVSFPTLGSDNTVTCPAGGLAQKIEPLNVKGGTYVISWQGMSTCTVDGTARVKGESFSLSANTLVDVKFSSGTLKNPQLELGSIATAFDFRPISEEMLACSRYFESISAAVLRGYHVTGNQIGQLIFYTNKRTTPTVTITTVSGISNLTDILPSYVTRNKCEIGATVTSTGGASINYSAHVSSEL